MVDLFVTCRPRRTQSSGNGKLKRAKGNRRLRPLYTDEVSDLPLPILYCKGDFSVTHTGIHANKKRNSHLVFVLCFFFLSFF